CNSMAPCRTRRFGPQRESRQSMSLACWPGIRFLQKAREKAASASGELANNLPANAEQEEMAVHGPAEWARSPLASSPGIPPFCPARHLRLSPNCRGTDTRTRGWAVNEAFSLFAAFSAVAV